MGGSTGLGPAARVVAMTYMPDGANVKWGGHTSSEFGGTQLGLDQVSLTWSALAMKGICRGAQDDVSSARRSLRDIQGGCGWEQKVIEGIRQ